MSNRAGTLARWDAGIFLVSVLILFLELVLIRWIGTEIRVFAYLGNLIFNPLRKTEFLSLEPLPIINRKRDTL